MKPVQQRKLWTPKSPTGDCVRACLASIFEVPYEYTEGNTGYAAEVRTWTQKYFPHLTYKNVNLIPYEDDFAEDLNVWKTWPTIHYEQDYWMATVWSPRIPDKKVYGCGCGADPECKWCSGEPNKRFLYNQWGLHAVVMKGSKCVWDPHPQRQLGFGPFVGATTWI